MFGMHELGLEGIFSIYFILPVGFTYKERIMSEIDQDAAELDKAHLKATGELKVTVTESVGEEEEGGGELILTAVIPSAAAFYYFPRVTTSHDELIRPHHCQPSHWARFHHVILHDDGTLCAALPGSIGGIFGTWGKSLVAASHAPQHVGRKPTTGLSELRVETRKVDAKSSLVRGSITLTPTGGYMIEAPKVFNDHDYDMVSEMDSASVEVVNAISVASQAHAQAQAHGNEHNNDHGQRGAPHGSHGGSCLGSRDGDGPRRPRVRIQVFVHPIVEDLVTMGVVRVDRGIMPILLSDPDGHSNIYNVLVPTSYIREVEGRVGPSFESRIVQVNKLNCFFLYMWLFIYVVNCFPSNVDCTVRLVTLICYGCCRLSEISTRPSATRSTRSSTYSPRCLRSPLTLTHMACTPVPHASPSLCMSTP